MVTVITVLDSVTGGEVSGCISGGYQKSPLLKNCVYSVQNLIRIYSFSVAVRRTLADAFEVSIDRAYRNQVSGAEYISPKSLENLRKPLGFHIFVVGKASPRCGEASLSLFRRRSRMDLHGKRIPTKKLSKGLALPSCNSRSFARREAPSLITKNYRKCFLPRKLKHCSK
jgi:hypothetical protein